MSVGYLNPNRPDGQECGIELLLGRDLGQLLPLHLSRDALDPVQQGVLLQKRIKIYFFFQNLKVNKCNVGAKTYGSSRAQANVSC